MKKFILVLISILIIYYIIGNTITKSIKIPEDAIRVRILANSNEEYDQNVKNKVKDSIQLYMYDLLKEADDSNEANKIVQSNLENIDSQVSNTLQILDYNLSYNINFGLNYFPKKDYKGVEYQPGYYQSLLITLGSGTGDNWWCVLFPPLCLIEAEESTDIEYKSFVQEILDKYV